MSLATVAPGGSGSWPPEQTSGSGLKPGCGEQYRVPSGRRLGRRRLQAGEAVAFGPGHVHDVAHGGDGSSTSIHAYSPPLMAMTYYKATAYGLIARETVAIDGPEGSRGRGGADTALAHATAIIVRRPVRHRQRRRA